MKFNLSIFTWLAFLLAAALWAYSSRLFYKRESGHFVKSMFLSFFGYAWMSFGILFILRFIFLLFDAELFRATIFPLWILQDYVLSITWLNLVLYWFVFCWIYLAITNWHALKPPLMLQRIGALDSIGKIKVMDAIFFISLVSSFIVNYPNTIVPKGLLTPIGRLGNLFVIPLTASWIMYFQKKPIGIRRLFYFLPVMIVYYLNPYREHIVLAVLCVLLPALEFGSKISFKRLLVSFLILLVVSTAVTSIYRGLKANRVDISIVQESQIHKDNILSIPKRFHGFDSMALTVYSVPYIFPYANRNIILELLVQIIPRSVLYTKTNVRRAREFSTGIWSVTERGMHERESTAMIAPSMPGDLYSSHGIGIVIIGSFIWGLIVGILEKWAKGLSPTGKVLLLTLFGLFVAGGIERDFVNASANIIQTHIVLLLTLAVFPYKVNMIMLPKNP